MPNIDRIKVLIIIIGNKDNTNDNVICFVALISDEKEETYIRLYNELKINYKFIPKYLSCDFSIANINATNKIYKTII